MANDDGGAYQGDQWIMVPDDGPEQAFRNPARAQAALMKLGAAGRVDSFCGANGVRKVVAECDDQGNWSSPAMAGGE